MQSIELSSEEDAIEVCEAQTPTGHRQVVNPLQIQCTCQHWKSTAHWQDWNRHTPCCVQTRQRTVRTVHRIHRWPHVSLPHRAQARRCLARSAARPAAPLFLLSSSPHPMCGGSCVAHSSRPVQRFAPARARFFPDQVRGPHWARHNPLWPPAHVMSGGNRDNFPSSLSRKQGIETGSRGTAQIAERRPSDSVAGQARCLQTPPT